MSLDNHIVKLHGRRASRMAGVVETRSGLIAWAVVALLRSFHLSVEKSVVDLDTEMNELFILRRLVWCSSKYIFYVIV